MIDLINISRNEIFFIFLKRHKEYSNCGEQPRVPGALNMIYK